MAANPERMRSTNASQATIVIEANEVVTLAAERVKREGSSGMFKTGLAKAAILFLRSGIQFKRKNA